MNFLLLSFLVFSTGAKKLDNPTRNEQSEDDKSFEKELEKGYELLKDQPNVDNTKELVRQLHDMDDEISDELAEPGQQNPGSVDNTKGDVDSEDVFILPTGDSIEEVNQQSNVAITLFEEDMVLTKKQADEILQDMKKNKDNRNKRQAIRSTNGDEKWLNGVFYYFYSNTSEQIRRVFTKAAHEWQKDTCIDFYENQTAPDRIAVLEATGCWSSVGRIGGEQRLSLSSRCNMVGNAAHEIGHALGFYHTHTRYDRNLFIKFYRKNVQPKYLSSFRRKTKRISNNYNLTYGFGSVMHYSARGSSKNKRPVMIPRDENYLYTIGSRMISFYDKLMMNTHYGCLDRCQKDSSADCQNGGFPHPRDCTKCVCPSGYGGTLCHERPEGCGEKLTANDSFQTLRSEVGNMNDTTMRDEYSMCTYWIEAPSNSKIEIEIDNFQYYIASDGCRNAGVEIKTGSNKRLTGYRFCSPKNYGVKLLSTYNVVPIVTYSNTFSLTTTLRYRIAPTSSAEISKTQQESTTTSGCRESSLCSNLLKWDFCKSTKFSEAFKKEVCPRSCGYCPSSPIS